MTGIVVAATGTEQTYQFVQDVGGGQMNPENYGTLEACQALEKAGIVMETECYWWNFGSYWKIVDHKHGYGTECVPAPSLAEMWRELPLLIEEDKLFLPHLVKISDKAQGGLLYSAYYSTPECSRPVPVVYQDANPTDALIHLRIWLKEKGEKG